MMTVVVVCIALSVAAFEIVYFAFFALGLPGISSLNELYFEPIDFVILAGSIIVGLMIASVIAVRIAKRILRPLRSVEQALRCIAQGDLSARALQDEHGPLEAAGLIDDFNNMADRLEQASKNISIWNAQIAHELRTPLTILGGRLQGVIDGVFEPDDRLIANLMVQVENLKRLVEDLRVVSLVDSGHLDLRVSRIEPAQEVRALVDLVQPRLADAGFTVIADGDGGEALLDASRLRQALLALIENARVHAPPGKLLIRSRLSEARVRFEVVDEGKGLPKDFIPIAFAQFARAEASNQRLGSGLGLSVVKAIAIAHGGDASYSQKNGRSTFMLDLPRWG
ncbi:ATP-binding protein [Sphingosinicella sp. BN140058]|uniref:ATP-binding protein n=1 Tax=Sphingosinicella sp. BN140058 TaxID=1892855 RepID=UPI0010128844|nr:ATP-binding protein [Sphingosinicella sp. BN140058]QAY78908.1 HAMP domain-containing histidine kinase [Sphingosinicella sp. BN140058]